MYSCTHFKIFISFSVLSAASHANKHRKMTLNLSWSIAMATANITIWHLFVVVIVVAVVHSDFGIQCVSLCSFDCMLCNISLINCILIHSQLYDTIFMEKHCILAQLRALFDMHSLLLWRISYIIFSEHTQTQKLTFFHSFSLSHTLFFLTLSHLHQFVYWTTMFFHKFVHLVPMTALHFQYIIIRVRSAQMQFSGKSLNYAFVLCLFWWKYKAFYLCNIETEISLFYKIIGGY